ncbi:conserved hypothetical protein [Talaromyces stipitatus ATCC 10500]|uniref:Rhodopsin domain-containing protein n=1 Tax=Talaromyces stipitatus (strain ATCC 10500 / CBS 375.48 / QM 6759 / NRRL 1006) TaxID=441959 RepID=B8M5A7_TALSN|nr:uncharacterized protein TSTA_029840 [Talaromyces stipitatus ATCC 10500]EED19713.1 conserved hypothetical protein [Talaromyces stipitatus ATCC 10500]
MSSPASASSEHSPEWLAENKGANILAPMWALTMITTSTVIARIYIRVKIVKNVGFDDWAIVVGLIFGLVYLGITTANVVVGYGRHADALDLPHLEKAILLNTIGFVFGILSFTIPKIAVAIMLTRILNPSKFHKYFIFSLVGFTASVAIVCILLLMTECDPPAAQWDKSIKNATCRDIWILIDFAVFTGALSAFVDLYLAIYPSVVLWKLNMSVKKRLALMGALGLGSIAAAMAVIKCTQLKGLADAADYTCEYSVYEYGASLGVEITGVNGSVFSSRHMAAGYLDKYRSRHRRHRLMHSHPSTPARIPRPQEQRYKL